MRVTGVIIEPCNYVIRKNGEETESKEGKLSPEREDETIQTIRPWVKPILLLLLLFLQNYCILPMVREGKSNPNDRFVEPKKLRNCRLLLFLNFLVLLHYITISSSFWRIVGNRRVLVLLVILLGNGWISIIN